VTFWRLVVVSSAIGKVKSNQVRSGEEIMGLGQEGSSGEPPSRGTWVAEENETSFIRKISCEAMYNAGKGRPGSLWFACMLEMSWRWFTKPTPSTQASDEYSPAALATGNYPTNSPATDHPRAVIPSVACVIGVTGNEIGLGGA